MNFFGFGKGEFRGRGDLPQYVVPSANHWKAEAAAKMAGWEDRMRPAVPPMKRPDVPATSVSGLGMEGIILL